MAVRLCLRGMRRNGRVGNEPRADPVPSMPAPAVRFGGDRLPGHPSAPEDLVSGDVADLLVEERHERAESTETARASELQHGVAVPAQVAPRDGPPRARTPFRHGRSR